MRRLPHLIHAFAFQPQPDVIPNRRGAAVRNLLYSALILAFAAASFAQAKHPFTFEDMMKLKRVGDPQVSPDGKWVIFSVVDVDLEKNTKTPHVWIVPLNGQTQGPSTAAKDSQANPSSSLGMTGNKSGMTEEREIISDQDADRPRWAPDGKRFAFISTKENGSQVWIADFDEDTGRVTRVHRLTDLATEASGELWSPDGKNVLFTSDVYPECDGEPAKEDNCNAQKVKAAQQSKVKALIFDHLLYRHWNAYKEGKRTHIFIISVDNVPLPKGDNNKILEYETIPPRDLTPGDYDAPVFSLGGQDDYAFSPDGQEICYTSNHDKNPAASTNNDLWIVSVNPQPAIAANRVMLIPSEAKNITADNPASDSTPLYSPDGRYIAYRAQQRPGYESDRFRLMLYDRKTGEKKNLTEGFDFWVGNYVWEGDSKTIDFSAGDADASPIYSVSLSGGLQGLARGFNDDLTVTPDGKQLFFTKMDLRAPVEIYRASTPKYTLVECESAIGAKYPLLNCFQDPQAVTHVNDSILAQIQMSPLEPFWFTGAHGDKVEGFLVKPPNFDAVKKYPVKFLIHGGPEGAWGDDWTYRWNAELFAAPTAATPGGYVVIMINFHGSTGYGQKFIDAINGDWGGAPFEDLMKGLDYAEEHYGFIDKTRECALGASYGGYMANWVLGHTDRFKCIVSHDGMFNAESAWGTTEELWFNDWEFKGTPYDNREMYRKWSPHEYAKNFRTPTLVIHGQRDYRLDVSQGFDLFTTLQMEGVPSKMLYFPDEGHWVLKPQNSQLWYKTVNDWVDQWIGK
jgi:dipeptidyl aminopeptidase/acylaminoacyl peptidase